jgi:hypothetical protein
MTLGYVMNKYAAPTVDPATIDQEAPQIPPVGSPLPNPVPTNPSPAPSGTIIVKEGCKLFGKQLKKSATDTENNNTEEPYNYCNELRKVHAIPTTMPIKCDELRRKAINNFDAVMGYFVGMKAIANPTNTGIADVTTGDFATDPLGNWNYPAGYSPARIRRTTDKWRAFAYCANPSLIDETRIVCSGLVPALATNLKTGRWELLNWSEQTLIQTYNPNDPAEVNKITFITRLADNNN